MNYSILFAIPFALLSAFACIKGIITLFKEKEWFMLLLIASLLFMLFGNLTFK